MDNITYNVLVIGGGPAGYTAAIYAARNLLNVLVIEDATSLTQLAFTDFIENYPGFSKGTESFELLTNFKEQALHFGATVLQAKVTDIEEREENARKIFYVTTSEGIIKAESIIAASGAKARKLDVPGEAEFAGRSVSYCGICDGPFFRNKHVAVVGGGDSAIQEALFLSKFASRVTIIHRRNELRAQKILQKKAYENPKINFMWNSQVVQINGADKVTSVTINNNEHHTSGQLEVDGIFIFVGHKPNTEYIQSLVRCNAEGYIETDKQMRTSTDGIFAAGDLRADSYRQIAIATGDGATAAISCEHYLSLQN